MLFYFQFNDEDENIELLKFNEFADEQLVRIKHLDYSFKSQNKWALYAHNNFDDGKSSVRYFV